MINWRDCIVPDIKLRNRVYVWVAYSKQYPYLPVAVADTAAELADIVNTTESNIKSEWYKYQHRKTKKSRYHRVKTGCTMDEK